MTRKKSEENGSLSKLISQYSTILLLLKKSPNFNKYLSLNVYKIASYIKNI